MNNARTETTRTWFLVIFGAFFAMPALYMLITMLGGSLLRCMASSYSA